MTFALSLLFKEMRKKFPLNNQTLDINPKVKENIKEIQSICNKEYFDQSFYGSAALNRKILLDKRIADLLTPETIIAILAIHAQTIHLDKNTKIGIWRNSSGYTSLAAALFYGFNEGLETIQLMPNNESHYGSKQYQEQKEKFEENTNKIIENIKKASIILKVSLDDEQFQLEEEKEQSLSQLFQSIENTIASIKKDHKEGELLFVPTYTSNEIRQQSVFGFKTICNVLKIQYSINKENAIVIDDSIALDDFIHQFLSSEEALLNGKVIHLFYDRAHLEACIEQNTKIIFQNKEYYLRDILREMVNKCETDSSVTQTAKEQFGIRLKLCDAHLRTNFSSYSKSESAEIKSPASEVDILHGYKQIKVLISDTESQIDKSLWTCKNLERQYAERDFLKKILEFYDDSEGKLPLTKCLQLAKWHYPEAYEQVKTQRGSQFFLNILNEKATQKPTQGPRLKNKASIALEKMLHALLTDYKTMNCIYNVLNELEITIDGKHFNITQILQNSPDFEHLMFTKEQLKKYADFVAKKAWNPPTFISSSFFNVIPNPEDYKKLDKNEENSHLHYGEKLAITVYSSNFYSKIQSFLREQGQSPSLRELSLTETHLIPEILLSTAIAAHGLSKPTEQTNQPIDAQSKNYRKEHANPKTDFFKSRLNSIKSKRPLFEKGFSSTSSTNSFQQRGANTLTIFHEDQTSNTLGKKIDSLSIFGAENEVLYGPGTQFQYTDYYKDGDQYFFAARPLRSLDSIQSDNYSNSMLAKHELEIIDKLLERYLTDNHHSLFRRLFDTVSNDDKLNCVRTAKIEIKKIFDNLTPDESVNYEQLETCKEALENAIETNKKLIESASGPASLGKTDKVLQEALLRVNRAINLTSAMDNKLLSTAICSG